ncbi:MAG: multi-sensor hybrid histidine kinase [Chloroflexi bacterium]|nr:MAG: multi-sensor hybrid histidine kinase [Chloroflexota bacterium]
MNDPKHTESIQKSPRPGNSRRRFIRVVSILVFAGLLLTGCQKILFPIPETGLKTITVVMDNNYPPFTFLDANGNLQGILIDQWRLWEQKTGIAVELTGSDWSEALRRMEAGEFDVIDTIFFNESRAKIYDFSKPYITIDVPIFFINEISGITDAESLKGFPVAVKAGDAVIDYLNGKGVENLLEYESYEAIIKAVVKREVIVFAIDKPPADYFLYQYSLQNQFNFTEPLYSGQFHRAVLKGNSDLLAMVENGFAQISKGEYVAIDRKWYGTPAFNDKNLFYVGIISASALTVFLVLILWNHSLRVSVKRKTKVIQESEQKFRQIFETARIGISIANEKGQFLTGNPAIFHILGYTPDEYSRLSIEAISHPDDTEKNVLLNNEMWTGQRDSFTLEKRTIHKDGHYVWGKVTSSIVRDAEGMPLFSIGMFEDITEQKISEKVQDAIFKVSQATISSATLDELYFLIHKVLSDLMPVENFYIALHDPNDNLLHFPFFRDKYEKNADPIEPGRSLTDYVLRTGRPLLATQAVFERLLESGEVELIGAKPVDWLGVPLKVNEQVIGVMATQSYSPEIHFNEKDAELLAFVSTQVAQAIERKRTEEALSKSEADMRALFAAMTDIILVFDRYGRYISILGTNTDLLYKPHDELIGKTLHEVLEKNEADVFLAHITSALTSRKNVTFEYSLPIEGKTFWFAASLSPVTEDTVIWVAHEITRRKQAEEAQRVSEARFRELFEDSPVSLWEEDFSGVKRFLDDVKKRGVTDIKAYFESHPKELAKCASKIKVLDVNKAALKLVHAKTKNELIGKISQVLGGNSQNDLIQEFVNIAAGMTEFEWEGINNTFDGESIIVSMHWSTALGYENSLSKVIVSLIDITKSKQAEAALFASEEQYRNLVDNLGEGIAVVDVNECFTFSNPSAHEIFGVSPGALVGCNINKFLDNHNQRLVKQQTQKRKKGEHGVYELEIIRPDGERRIIQISARPQVDNERGFIGTFAIFHDITVQKKSVEQLHFRSRFDELLTQISTRFINFANIEIDAEINTALRLIGQLENVDRSYLLQIDTNNKTMTNTHEWCEIGIDPQINSIQNQPISAMPWFFDRIVDEPVIINRVADLPEEALLEKKIFESQDIQSLAVFPMQVNQLLIGFVGFDTVLSERKWEKDSTTMMQQFTNILSNALERSRLIRILEDRAIRDELTGVLNRRGFSEFAKIELSRAHRYDRPVGMLLFDMDHLKQINDTFGHSAGDLALQEIVKCCLSNIREIDSLGRWGGDEFVVLLPESDQSSTNCVAERLLTSIANHSFVIEGNPVKLSVSIGMAVDDKTKLTLDELFRNADSALYAAKQAGRNCIRCVPKAK